MTNPAIPAKQFLISSHLRSKITMAGKEAYLVYGFHSRMHTPLGTENNRKVLMCQIQKTLTDNSLALSWVRGS